VTPENIEATWQDIEAEGKAERGWHVRQLSGAGSHTIMVGRKAPTGTVGLLYEIASSSVPADLEWPDGKGFSTDIETLVPGPSGRLRLILQLANSQYRDVFSALCSDVAGIIAGKSSQKSGVTALVRRLHAWQKFMQLHSRSGLSAEQVRGLYSELGVLEHLLMPHVGHTEAVEMWQGRQGLHDFRNGERALEVKSSTVKSDPVVSISRLNQIDEADLASLHLCFVPIEEGHDQGETLPDAISRLREALKDQLGAAQRLEDLLVAYGYHDSQAGLYSEILLRSGQPQLFLVSGQFPRLQVSEISNGIVSGKYSIRLSACADYLVDQTTFLDEFVGVNEIGK